jgi:hypothetical protein
MNYEVFDPSGSSVFPYGGGGGLQPFNVNSGDTVLLSLNFTSSNVMMMAYDWNTSSPLAVEFSSGLASHFVGLPNSSAQNGFFSGLMTEQYHSNPYYGAGQPVLYTTNLNSVTSAWMWMDEFNANSNHGPPVFLDQTPTPVYFPNGAALQYFSSNGTAEGSGPQQLVTGITPVTPPSLESGKIENATRGQDSLLTIGFANYTQAIMRIAGITLASDFGDYTIATGLPFLLNVTSPNFHATVNPPSSTYLGNHTLTITASWQFFNQQTQVWIAPGPVTGQIILRLIAGSNSTSSPPPSPPPSSRPPSSGPSSSGPTTSSKTKKPGASTGFTLSLPMIQLALTFGVLVYVALVVCSLILLARTRRGPSQSGFAPTQQICLGCRGEVNPTQLFCPNCGRPTGTTTPA